MQLYVNIFEILNLKLIVSNLINMKKNITNE